MIDVRCATLLASALLAATTVQAAEPVQVPAWADVRLELREGLDLWIDVSAQNAARRAQDKDKDKDKDKDQNLPALADGDLIDRVYDASGHERHLEQPDEAARPRYREIAATGVARFDGLDDHLSREGLGRQYAECTIFIVANPFSSAGEFRGLLAMNRAGGNDYQTGLNLDLGPLPSVRFETLNVEGPGFGGWRNLLGDPSRFGVPRLIALTSAAGPGGTRVWIDGRAGGARDRAASVLHADQVTLGARFYNNAGPANVRGFLEGDVAELLIYGRVLDDRQRREVESYLAGKYAGLMTADIELPGPSGGGKRLQSVPSPSVQMFVPGFAARQLPIELPNVNNVRYRPDGKLVALAYDGNVYLLHDTDGDGLEDQAKLFWDNQGRLRSPIGMALTPPGYAAGQGLFVASKGKCSLIVDEDGDDVADREIIVAEGWPELPHGVDALGVAFDQRDGSLYFGLGATDFTNPYLLDPQGRAGYRLASERGTVLKVAPDFKSREVLCTGIRFPVAMAFNRHGDLFATDQEGATWLANGNPLDELLHLEQGRHYGFPPRHPSHLPDVIDEPSTFDYRPQHQSTCGLVFNDPADGNQAFGPAWWAGDALVCGYSRGKLYRTKLAKTPAGYVAQNQQLAVLDMLAVDACPGPRGELVIAVHSGGPDWGAGPAGAGKLYKIEYRDRKAPQPVAVWAQSPHEVRIAFDSPLDPGELGELTSNVSIEFGRYVAAGDRFEALRPGYQAVHDQLLSPRFDLDVHAVQITSDRRTLVLTTSRQEQSAGYAITLAGTGHGHQPAEPQPTDELPQVAAIDLEYRLSGVAAEWRADDGQRVWQGWLPHLDLAVSRALTANSADHDALWAAMQQPGRLTLRTRLDLSQMLRPAVQPGLKIDYELPAEHVTLSLSSAGRMEVDASAGAFQRTTGGPPDERVTVSVAHESGDPLPLTVHLATGSRDPDLSLVWHTSEDSRPRALPLERFVLPWAVRGRDLPQPAAARTIPELEGGSWARGRKVFFGERAACSRCHAVDGQGALVGPNLSNLRQRDYGSVLRDVTEPSYAINPDYVTYQIVLADGRLLEGTVRSEQDKLHVANGKGEVTTIDRSEIDEMAPASLSIMPADVAKQLTADELRDLLTFLLGPGPRMPQDSPAPPPPPRSRAEVQRALAGAPDHPGPRRRMSIVLVAGPKDHGPGEHDYPAWQKAWSELLAAADETEVTTAWEWPSEEQFRSADVLVFYQLGTWTPQRAADIDPFLARGGGLVSIHFAVRGGPDAEGFAERIGLAWRDGQSRFRHGPLELRFRSGHPITRNLEKLHFHDESYWRLTGRPARVDLLADGIEEAEPQPLVWAVEQGRGRVVVSIPGHFSWTFDDPLFRLLLLRGIAWSAREPVDRFNDLVTLGARVAE